MQCAHFPDLVDKIKATGIQIRCHVPERWPAAMWRCPRHGRLYSAVSVVRLDVDLIILGSDSPDYITPTTFVVLQHKLRRKKVFTFDVGCAYRSFRPARQRPASVTSRHFELEVIV